ncbi:MAG: nickel pincer cofactor biosynthesis protein LarB [Candidatus Eisenbacteria bacterium]|nr:nickel pincer cofactor biosynthesis protein LarB [Candidatus Eisenbacteria bacterium]
MNEQQLRDLLAAVREGTASTDEAVGRLRHLPGEVLADLTIDHHRELRCGFPEVILATGKTAEQVEAAAVAILNRSDRLLITRVSDELALRLSIRFPELQHDVAARAFFRRGSTLPTGGRVGVITAGTADVPVAAEAALTASLFGHEVTRITDVGVAGVHRLLARIVEFRDQEVLVVVAGMEGALPSVVAGLVDIPVIAVPTSVGYGASFGGLAALLGMLNSCASGVTVVNIDNGFGAGYAAGLIARRSRPPREGA